VRPTHSEVSLTTSLRELVQILVLAERVEEGVDLGIRVAVADHLHRGTGDTHGVEDLLDHGTGDHLSGLGGGADHAATGVVLAEQVVRQTGVLVQINVHQVAQSIASIENLKI
jgi:hypothetical protein